MSAKQKTKIALAATVLLIVAVALVFFIASVASAGVGAGTLHGEIPDIQNQNSSVQTAVYRITGGGTHDIVSAVDGGFVGEEWRSTWGHLEFGFNASGVWELNTCGDDSLHGGTGNPASDSTPNSCSGTPVTFAQWNPYHRSFQSSTAMLMILGDWTAGNIEAGGIASRTAPDFDIGCQASGSADCIIFRGLDNSRASIAKLSGAGDLTINGVETVGGNVVQAGGASNLILKGNAGVGSAAITFTNLTTQGSTDPALRIFTDPTFSNQAASVRADGKLAVASVCDTPGTYNNCTTPSAINAKISSAPWDASFANQNQLGPALDFAVHVNKTAVTITDANFVTQLAGTNGGGTTTLYKYCSGTLGGACSTGTTFVTCTVNCTTAAGTNTACTINTAALPINTTARWRQESNNCGTTNAGTGIANGTTP